MQVSWNASRGRTCGERKLYILSLLCPTAPSANQSTRIASSGRLKPSAAMPSSVLGRFSRSGWVYGAASLRCQHLPFRMLHRRRRHLLASLPALRTRNHLHERVVVHVCLYGDHWRSWLRRGQQGRTAGHRHPPGDLHSLQYDYRRTGLLPHRCRNAFGAIEI